MKYLVPAKSLSFENHLPNTVGITGRSQSGFTQSALPLRRFLGKDVGSEGLMTADFPTPGRSETLHRATTTFHLGHSVFLLCYS
jgi:hypothetical protein